MVPYCSHCGEKLTEVANFCPKCGTRTQKGIEAGITIPADEFRQAFTKLSDELEKAFSKVADEVKQAFTTTRENIRETTGTQEIACPHCGTKNPVGSGYCYKCGKKLKRK
jgi:predicted RNA-binding Zn-ribbon protein involved in translation (DUF1610 family)